MTRELEIAEEEKEKEKRETNDTAALVTESDAFNHGHDMIWDRVCSLVTLFTKEKRRIKPNSWRVMASNIKELESMQFKFNLLREERENKYHLME